MNIFWPEFCCFINNKSARWAKLPLLRTSSEERFSLPELTWHDVSRLLDSVSKLTLGVLGLLQERKVAAACAHSHVFIHIVARAWNLFRFHASRGVVQRIKGFVHLITGRGLVKCVVVRLGQGRPILHLEARERLVRTWWRHFCKEKEKAG